MPEIYTHKNGHGRIIGTESGIGADCLLSRDSQIEGRSFVSYQSSIIKASAIKDSSISMANIQASAILESHVSAALVSHSALKDVIVRGAGENKAVVQNAVLGGKAVIEGCTLRNCEINAPILVHRGTWNRAPRYRVLEIGDQVVLGLSECVDEHYHTGCECRSFDEWDRKEPLLRKLFVERRGWPLEEFNSIRGIFESWRGTPIK